MYSKSHPEARTQVCNSSQQIKSIACMPNRTVARGNSLHMSSLPFITHQGAYNWHDHPTASSLSLYREHITILTENLSQLPSQFMQFARTFNRKKCTNNEANYPTFLPTCLHYKSDQFCALNPLF